MALENKLGLTSSADLCAGGGTDQQEKGRVAV